MDPPYSSPEAATPPQTNTFEQRFQGKRNSKTLVKKGFANELSVLLDKINISDDPSLLRYAYDMLT
ncbi:hypothetical protein HBH98_255340 [Parastagonospora nodorum]|nr:hypothetical protein HBH53_261940 [Parastagonospora nodorum]KAH3956015.1 hypothetical protein HBH51_258270 [Parastagonospora nodorum]KAH4215287.1 hypothetical protein HBI06_257630 [Parastagonospora nodorum]KAH4221701.1 hypothetical protein HBI05_255750 [Parastagonospora nodorum]KAH4331556.1 hypothetical protein HBH98_255340 [Parastagonospora nodorum]